MTVLTMMLKTSATKGSCAIAYFHSTTQMLSISVEETDSREVRRDSCT